MALLVVLLAGLVVVPGVGAQVNPGTVSRWEAAMKVPKPPVLDVRLAECPDPLGGGRACTRPGGPIFLHAIGDWRFTLYHEIGHQFDWQVATPELRRYFRRITHNRGRWRTTRDHQGLDEQFADAYAICASPRATQWKLEAEGYVQSEYYWYRARWSAHRKFCRALWR